MAMFETRATQPTDRTPDEPCSCGKWILRPWWEAVTDAGTDRLRHSRTECLTAAEKAGARIGILQDALKRRS